MDLVIIAKDYSGKNVKLLAEKIGKWNNISVVESSSDDSVQISDECEFVIASVDPKVREEEFTALKEKNAKLAVLVHPQSYVNPATQIGEGCIVMQGVIVYDDSTLCDNVLLMEYSSVSHDSIVGSHAVLMEKVTVAGHGHVGKGALLSANTVVKETVKILDGAVCEPGSVVMSDVAEDTIVAGNPARIKRH
ncbi:MAG: hypothetical protein IKG93_03260 [Clostridiales bacterium]|nr:hypothetical protein [Clostridiales bacterium]